MSYVEPIASRAAAFGILGLDPTEDVAAINAAWRRVAFDVHPDRNAGDPSQFLRARAAYDFVTGNTGPRGSVRPRPRPSVAAKVEPIPPAAIKACRALLEQDADPTLDGHALHVPDRIARRGRTITYIAETPLAAGRNRIALPSALLAELRRFEPRLLSLTSANAGPGEIKVPDSLRESVFPGARAVSIRFGTP